MKQKQHQQNHLQRATPAKLRKAAGSKSLESLQQVIETGWTAHDIDFESKQEASKGALHMAAWQGCLENVQYLLHLGCDINCISKGTYSYGKTPIFFAATRSRNDIVEYLLDRGAFVKIVNNKGQSLLSIASSHLSSQVIFKIQQKEQEQSTMTWWNFRKSHSDGLEYGDLDPRFLDRSLRPGDIVTSLAINPTTKQTRKGGFLRRNPHVAATKSTTKDENDTITPSKTTRKKPKQPISLLSPDEEKELSHAWISIEQTLTSENNSTIDDTLLLRIVRLGDKQKRAWIPETSKRLLFLVQGDVSKMKSVVDLSLRHASDREASLLQKIVEYPTKPENNHDEKNPNDKKVSPSMIELQKNSNRWNQAFRQVTGLSISHLETQKTKLSTCRPPIWVDTVTELHHVKKRIQDCQLLAIDTEWCTTTSDNKERSAIATLQIAICETPSSCTSANAVVAFVIDLLVNKETYQTVARELVQWLLESSSNVLLLGFAFANDMAKLNEFIGVPHHHSTRPFLDLQLLMATKSSSLPGLKECALRFTSIPLLKDEQCSNWSQRPLSTSQLEYAALDAEILLFLLEEIRKRRPRDVENVA